MPSTGSSGLVLRKGPVCPEHLAALASVCGRKAVPGAQEGPQRAWGWGRLDLAQGPGVQ